MNKIALLFSLYVFLMGCGNRHDNGWDRLNEQIKEKYPEVEHITTSELNDLMKKEEVVIIDVREKDELRNRNGMV